MPDHGTQRFYLYGTFSEGSDTLPTGAFSFVVDSFRELESPSFLIWFYRDTNGKALLCKIRRTTRPADIGMKVYVYEALPIRLVAHGLLNSLYPEAHQELGRSPREQVSDILLERDFVTVPEDKANLIKNCILKSNPTIIDESYFLFDDTFVDDEIVIEATDAIYTGFRIFGIPVHDIPNLREQQILDFDIETLFADAEKLGVTPDGKHFFDHGSRRLYLHKVDRTPIEECLGVDLIYNFLDQRRLVFVQYKCQRAQGKYYRASDASHDSEIERMAAIPGLSECWNLREESHEIRLCRCPVFVKLCKREISHAHAVPIGVYYPLCVWRWQIEQRAGVSIRDEPHINNHQFQELVKTGLIGSTTEQSFAIERHLVEQANDKRLKLVFEETVR